MCVEECVCNLVFRTAQCYCQRLHSSDHGLHGCDDILEHQLGESFPVLLSVASTVNDAHLFDEGTLPAFTCAWGWDRLRVTRETNALLYWVVRTAATVIKDRPVAICLYGTWMLLTYFLVFSLTPARCIYNATIRCYPEEDGFLWLLFNFPPCHCLFLFVHWVTRSTSGVL